MPRKGTAGSVRVYRRVGTTKEWKQLGVEIAGTDEDRSFGYAVALSSDGLTIAVGGPSNYQVCVSNRSTSLSKNFLLNQVYWEPGGGCIPEWLFFTPMKSIRFRPRPCMYAPWGIRSRGRTC